MHSSLLLALAPLIRMPMVCLVALALVIYGHSATMVQVLGPAHRHQAAAPEGSINLWQEIDKRFGDIRAWRADLQVRLMPGKAHVHGDGSHLTDSQAHAMDSPEHTHAHATYQRHRHDPQDASVVSLDGMNGAAADAASQAAAGSATLPLALATRWTVPGMAGSAFEWPQSTFQPWTDVSMPPSERPPRA